MEQNILDGADAPNKEQNNAYSEKAFKCLLNSFGLFFIALIGVSLQTKSTTPNGFITMLIGLPMILIILISFIGLRAAILSFKKQESNKWTQYIGLIGNLFVLLLFLCAILADQL